MDNRYDYPEPKHTTGQSILRNIFWGSFYAISLLPMAIAALTVALLSDSLFYWMAPTFVIFLILALLLLPLAILGAIGDAFKDTPRQRWLFLGSILLVALYSVITILSAHPAVVATSDMIALGLPQHVWDIKTIFVYSYQFLYVSFLVGALAMVLRFPRRAAWLLLLGLALRTFEVLYSEHVNDSAFRPTHLVQYYDEFEDIPLDEMDPYSSVFPMVFEFTMRHTPEFVTIAILIALFSMARKRPAQEPAEEG